MPANLVFKTSDGLSDLGPLNYTGTDRGTTTAATAFRLLNDDSGGSVDDANEPYIEILQDDGAGEAVRSGFRAVDERWAEIRALGTGSSGSTQQATAWQPVGANRRIAAAALPEGEYSDWEIRLVVPSNASVGSLDLYLFADDDSQSESTSTGITDGRRDGVLSGIGDSSWDHIILGGDVTEDSPAGANVVLPDLAWMVDGEPHVALTQEIATNGNDGSAVALASGEAYFLVLSLAADGSITETKGDKGTEPLDASTDAPAVPAGEIPLARINRPFDGTINDSDITMLSSVGRFFAVTSPSSLDVVFGPGRAFVDNSLIRVNQDTTVTLSASSTNGVWLQVDGSFAVETDGVQPTPRAVRLWSLVTDGSGVTSAVDYREAVGGEVVSISFRFSTVADTTVAYAVNPHGRSVFVRPQRGVVLALDTNGSGNTTGITAADVEKSVAGAAFSSLFTSSGTDDRRPAVEHDDSENVDREALPEVLEVEPFALLRATIDRTQAYDGTAPADGATLILLGEMY